MPCRRAGNLALVALALLAPACGGDEPLARAPDGRASIALDDFLIAPQRLAADRRRVTLAVANRGRIGHTLRLRRGERIYAEVSTLLPGERTTITRTLPRGRYRMFCAIANHEELGMHGVLEVRGG